MTSAYEPGSVIEPIAMFPLPEAVLFPGAMMPLHVFEPRYRQMTADAIEGDGRMCIGFIPNDAETDENGNPRVAGIAGIGEIVEHRERPDGRYDIAVVGYARARIEELPFDPPYRRVRATVLGERSDGPSETDMAALVSTATRFAELVRPRAPGFELSIPGQAEPGQVADLLAHVLVLDGDARQELLEELDAGERVRRCTEALATQHAILCRSSVLN